MAYSGNPAQQHSSNPQHIYSQTQVDANVYDLDDPYLIPKILNQQQQQQQQQYPRVAAGSITCRFFAIPLNEPYSFFHNMAQYGYIVHESKDKLIMRLPYHSLDLLNHVRQVWVSKYLAPFTECRLTFDMPRQDPGRTTLIIIQRVFSKINKSGAGALVGGDTADLDIVVDGRTALLPEFSGEDAVPHIIARRVCNYGNGGVW
ncbi:hypothetical protein F4782DRAFT_515724 [Xylaria castorea]|nr:hypothetical protein F4782DRAFT_515724 [Xylaria castorea]